MIKKILEFTYFIAFSFLLFPQYVKADECTKEQVNLFNNLVNNIEISYKHVEDNIFSVEIYNIPKEINVYDIYGNKFSYNENGISVNSGYKGNTSYEFRFLPNEWNCELPLNFRKSIYIKKYNLYSLKKECDGIDYTKFKYCDPYYQGKITDEIFNKELKNFNSEKIDKTNDNNIISVNEKKDFNTQIYYFIFGFIGILLLIVTLFIIKKKIKNKGRKI